MSNLQSNDERFAFAMGPRIGCTLRVPLKRRSGATTALSSTRADSSMPSRRKTNYWAVARQAARLGGERKIGAIGSGLVVAQRFAETWGMRRLRAFHRS